MPHAGSATVITPSIRLILLDCFDTLVELHPTGYRPRRGMLIFLEHFGVGRGIPLAVVSDAHLDDVQRAILHANLAGYIKAVYHQGNAIQALGAGRTRKRLDLVLADFSVQAQDALFIGDSPLDAIAAQHYGLSFIRVPRSEDRSFDFASLITGPSHYHSEEFDATFCEHYRTRPADPPPP